MTKIGGYLVGIGAGAAALVWLIKDRLLGPESVPVTAEDAPAFRVAPGPPSAVNTEVDDLSQITGIGPVYRARLEQAGISSFAALAAATTQEIATAAEVADERADDWRSQASSLTT
jgi:predicted flap endonuclease-1-like 5' DNA nuclease